MDSIKARCLRDGIGFKHYAYLYYYMVQLILSRCILEG